MFNGIGIDFGTTAWRAAICKDGACHAVPDGVCVPGQRGLIKIEAGNRWLYIKTAKANLGLGRRLQESQADGSVTFETQAQAHLQLLRERLATYRDAAILGAAVAAPPCYGLNQRAALRSLAQAVGFGNVTLIDESLAAALLAYQGQREPTTVLVYCLGQSVFFVSVLQVGNGMPRALNHEGSTQLGSQDIDALLTEEIARWLARENIRLTDDRDAIRRLLVESEKAKIRLSTDTEARVNTGRIRDRNGLHRERGASVSRADLEDVMAPVVEETVALSRKAIEGAGLQTADISEILLVGAPTRTPLIVRRLREAFGRPLREAPPDSVACGAALYAASLYDCFTDKTPVQRQLAAPAPAASAPPASPPPAASIPVPGPSQPADTTADDPLFAALQRVRAIRKTGDMEASITAFEGMIEQAQEEVSYLYSQLAAQLRLAGRLDDAEARLERGLAHWPANVHISRSLAATHVEKAWVFYRAGIPERAREYMNKCLKRDPDNPSARQLERELKQKTTFKVKVKR
jgi:tetratricopeptide (TPR) repeat protein